MTKLPCRTVFGKDFEIEVSPNQTISDIKEIARSKVNLPPGTIKIVFGGKFLEDETPIRELRIPASARIMVHASEPRRTPAPPPPRIRPPPPPLPASSAPPSGSTSRRSLRDRAAQNTTEPSPSDPSKPTHTESSKSLPQRAPTPTESSKPLPQRPPTPTESAQRPPAESAKQLFQPARSGKSVPQPKPEPQRPPPPSHVATKPAQKGSNPSDPPNFMDLVGTLVAMGFDETRSVATLRSKNYDLERAANTLAVNAPSATSAAPPSTQIPVRVGRYGEFQPVFDDLSKKEKSEVERLAKHSGDPIIALEVYIACEKNESAARDVMNTADFAALVSQLKQHPEYGSEFHGMVLSSPAQAIANFIAVAIDPQYSNLFEYSMILLGRFASVLCGDLPQLDESFQAPLRQGLHRLLAQSPAQYIRHVSHAIAKLAQPFLTSPAWIDFLFGDPPDGLTSFLTSPRSDIIAAVLDCWSELLELSTFEPPLLIRLAAIQQTVITSQLPADVYLAGFRLGYNLHGRVGAHWQPFAERLCSCLEASEPAVLRPLLHDLLSFLDDETDFLAPVFLGFVPLMVSRIPAMAPDTKCYGLKVLTAAVSHNYESLLETGLGESSGNAMLHDVITLFLAVLAGSDLSIDLDCPDGVDDLVRRTAEECLGALADHAYGDNQWHVELYELFDECYRVSCPEFQVALWIFCRLSTRAHSQFFQDEDLALYRDCLAAALGSPIASLRYYGLIGWESIVRFGGSDLFFAEQVLPALFAALAGESAPEVVTAVLRVAAAYVRHCPSLPDGIVADVLGLAVPLFRDASRVDQLLSLAALCGACMRAAPSAAAPFVAPCFDFFRHVLAGGPRELFFHCLRLFPSFSRVLPADTFDPAVGALLARVLDDRAYAELGAKDRSAVHKFLRALLAGANRALVAHAGDVVRFLLRGIAQPLEPVEVNVDDATESVYFVLRKSVETGIAVCYANSELGDVVDAFRVLGDALQVDCHAFAGLVDVIMHAYVPWLERAVPEHVLLPALAVGLGLFRYLAFGEPSRAEFALWFYQRLIDALPAFLVDGNHFARALAYVYTALNFFARFLPALFDVPIAAVAALARTLPDVVRRIHDTASSERWSIDGYSNWAEFELPAIRILIAIGRSWPAVVPQLPVGALLTCGGNLRVAVAVVVAVHAPDLVSEELRRLLADVREPLGNPQRTQSLALALFFCGELARVDRLESSAVEIFAILENDFAGLEKVEDLVALGEAVVIGMVLMLTKYSAVVDCSAGWNLFWKILELPLVHVDVLLVGDAIQDLEVLVQGLDGDEKRTAIGRLIGLVEELAKYPWEKEAVKGLYAQVGGMTKE